MKITLVQLNFCVGDIAGNSKKILHAYEEATSRNSDLVICSELAITGYPPEDLVLRPSFQKEAMQAINNLAIKTKKTTLIVGSIWVEDEQVFNAAFELSQGKIRNIYYKNNLPNYGVFDEKRIFTKGTKTKTIRIKNQNFGISICEDLWKKRFIKMFDKTNLHALISINASPYEIDKYASREIITQNQLKKLKCPVIYVNQVGGQDELVFDGHSFISIPGKGIVCRLPEWEEAIEDIEIDLKTRDIIHPPPINPLNNRNRSIYGALTTALHDYINKNNFPGVVIGMSGGIDSALSAAIAVDALGKDKVRLFMLPSEFTSHDSIKDATDCAKKLDLELESIAINPIVEATNKQLHSLFSDTISDLTEENIQSRIRGMLLMAISNKFGPMVLTTGNKSEMAVGYATLYGDMCGGYNLLKDIYKTDVYALAKWRNQQEEIIPTSIIQKPPSAELRPNQTDQDSLPPYDILDTILYHLIELRESTHQISKQQEIDAEIVTHIATLVKQSEYKRRQAPMGPKLSELAFGKDRRYPVSHRFRF